MRKLSEDPRITLQVRATLAERQVYIAAAKAEGIALSEWLRRAADAALSKCSSCGAKKRRK